MDKYYNNAAKIIARTVTEESVVVAKGSNDKEDGVRRKRIRERKR